MRLYPGARDGQGDRHSGAMVIITPTKTIWRLVEMSLAQFDHDGPPSSSNTDSDVDPTDVEEDSSSVSEASHSDSSSSEINCDDDNSDRSSIHSGGYSDFEGAQLSVADSQIGSDSDNDSDDYDDFDAENSQAHVDICPEQNIREQPSFNIFQNQKRDLLYPWAQITAEESEVLIKAFIVRWNIENNAVEHLLKLLDCHMPTPMLGSQYCFLKKFPTAPIMKSRYFCAGCSQLLPPGIENNTECECWHLCSFEELKKDSKMFVQLSLSEQIKQLMSKPEVVSHIRRECEESDVVSGKLYKRFREVGAIGGNDISLQWNTDGVSPCKTSKVSMFPIYVCVNELPYHIRIENMILCGLYYGKSKPDMNTILKPFIDELNLLREVGLDCIFPGRGEPVNIKVYTILCSVDSVARAPLQGIMAHNGRHGCSFCLRRGKRLERGKGYARFYVGGHAGLPRSSTQHTEALEALLSYNATHRRKKKHVQGVTKESILLSLRGFDIAKSFVPDYMHLVLEGVVKTFWSHWTSVEYDKELWYMSKQKRFQLNEKLLAIKPPLEVSRVPRSTDDMSYWRAHEIKSFLMYYSLACLKGILPSNYLKHWFLLVYSITIFLKEKIVREEFMKATLALQKFVQGIIILYPQCHSLHTCNTHMLLHISKSVENFGALWASSTFPYENSNCVLSRFIRSSQGVPLQRPSSFLRLRHVNDIGFNVFTKNSSSKVGKELFHSMLGKSSKIRRSYKCSEGLRYFRGPHNYTPSLVEKSSLQELLGKDVDDNAPSYQRLNLNGKVFHVETCGALKMMANSFAKLSDGVSVVINAILQVKLCNSDEVVSACICEILQRFDESLCRDTDVGISSTNIMLTCCRSGRIISILPSSIHQKLVGVPYAAALCVMPLTNTIERD